VNASDALVLSPSAAPLPPLPGLPVDLDLVGAPPAAAASSAEHNVRVAARERVIRRSLVLADTLAVLLAPLIALTLVGGIGLKPAVLVVLPLIVVAVAKMEGLYDRDDIVIRKTTLEELPHLFRLSGMLTLAVWLLDRELVTAHEQLASGDGLVLWSSLLGIMAAGRVLARRLSQRAVPVERCLLIGDARTFARLAPKLQGTRTELVGRLSLRRASRRGCARTTHARELQDLIAWTGAHRLIIEPHTLPPDEMLELVRTAKSMGVPISLIPSVLDVVGSSVVFDDLGGMTVLGVRRLGLSRSSYLVKRAFDLAVGGLLLVFVAPLMLVIAALVKLDSPGPVLFRQTRIGRDDRPFRICKFRTMVPDAEHRKGEMAELNECEGGMFKIAADPRITRVGRWLRRTSLDELPQLLNVLAGSMSLVGPRPLILDEDQQITGWERTRLHLTPGMTGHWQILGSSRIPLPEMVKIDYLYVAGWSLWSDVKILLRTVPYVLARRGM